MIGTVPGGKIIMHLISSGWVFWTGLLNKLSHCCGLVTASDINDLEKKQP